MHKLVNGIETPCTPEEEAHIRAEWEANKKSDDASMKLMESRFELEKKYGNLYEAFEKLCNKLGIKFEQI